MGIHKIAKHIVYLYLFAMVGCTDTGSSSQASNSSLNPPEPTIQLEIQKINNQLNQGSSLLSKQDLDSLVQEGVISADEINSIRPFVQE